MNPDRGVKNPPGSATSDVVVTSDEGDLWEEEEDLFGRPTLIPEQIPTEAMLIGRAAAEEAQRQRAALIPTPVPPVPPVDEGLEWEHSSTIVRKSATNASELELDLDDLGPPSTPLGHRPAPAISRGPGKAKPISLHGLPPVPVAPRFAPESPAGRVAAPPSATRTAPQPAAPKAAAVPPSPASAPRAVPSPPSAVPTAPQRFEPPPPASASRSNAITVPPPPPPREPAPTLFEEDPLAFDLADELASPPRVDLPDDLSIDLDAVRDPKMPEPPRRPASEVPDEPKTAPYLLDDYSTQDKRYVAGQLRQPPAIAPATHPIASLDELFENTTPGPSKITERPVAVTPHERMMREVRDKLALGDFSGALKGAEAILEYDGHHTEARQLAETCRQRLRGMFEAKLGSMRRVPRLLLPPDQVRWLSLDHRAGFILSCIDGYSSIEEILDVSGMPSFDALRILHDLLQQKVIAVT